MTDQVDVFSVDKGLEFVGTTVSTQLLNGIDDPSQSPGVPAPISSSYTRAIINQDGVTYTISMYDKIGPLDTDWALHVSGGGSDGTLGNPTDGTYADGLFPFTATTKTGDAVDSINEFLSLMAPPPAPNLTNLDSALSGVTGKLSFDATHTISGYTYDSAVINATISRSGTNLGIFNGNTTITGILNNNVSANTNNAWPAKSFGQADTGNLILTVNGVAVQTTDLSTFVSGASVTSGSGFTLSAANPVKFSNGNEFPAMTYRTGTLTIASGAQRPGYNVASVSQVINGNTQTTNQYYWYNSVDTTALTASGVTLTPSMSGNRNLSGVKYYNSGTLRVVATVSAAYRDVYSASGSAVSVSGPHASFSSSGLPSITSNTADLAVDVTGNFSGSVRLLGVITSATLSVSHPLKSSLSNTSQTSKILYDPIVSASTILSESFTNENYRIETVPASASTTPSVYDSSVSLLTNGGLQFYNGALVYPKLDFRSVADGGTIDISPSSNRNYVGATGNRTFMRVFQNNTSQTRANFKLNFSGSSTTFVAVGTLTGNNMSVEIKFPPGSLAAGTGWTDAYKDFATGQWADGAGSRNESSGVGRALNTDWGLTIGTQTIAINEYIYLRITVPSTWTGSLTGITLTWL